MDLTYRLQSLLDSIVWTPQSLPTYSCREGRLRTTESSMRKYVHFIYFHPPGSFSSRSEEVMRQLRRFKDIEHPLWHQARKDEDLAPPAAVPVVPPRPPSPFPLVVPEGLLQTTGLVQA